MEEFVPFDASKHLGEFRQLNIETTTWYFDQLRENYEVDASLSWSRLLKNMWMNIWTICARR
jgi:hypothetical protein